MEKLVFFVLFCFIFCFVLLVLLSFNKRYFRESKGIVNYDFGMHYLVFRLTISEDEFLRRLQIRNIADECEYQFSPERRVISFTYQNVTDDFAYELIARPGYSILILRRLSTFLKSGNLLCAINLCFIKKLDAELIPYSDLKNY